MHGYRTGVDAAGPQTLAYLVDGLLDRTHGRLFFPEVEGSLPYSELPAGAYGVTAGLLKSGAQPGSARADGEMVGILAPNSLDYVVALLGIFAGGMVAVPIPVPPFGGDPAAALNKLRALLDGAKVRYLLVAPPFDAAIDALRTASPHITVIEIGECRPSDRPAQLQSPGPSNLALVQFSSGSTAAPKGILIEHGALLSSVENTATRSSITQRDSALLWLPLFHDFGLVTLLVGLLTGSDIHLFNPTTFVRRTDQILRYMADRRVSMFAGPNFAYERLLAKAGPDGPEDLDLSAWRLAVNAGEPIAAATIDRFNEKLAPFGVTPTVMNPGYGMAEFCVGISYQEAGRITKILAVERDSLRDGRRVVRSTPAEPGTIRLVSQGPPFPAVDIRIRDTTGRVLPPEHCGEIEARGANMLRGYLSESDTADALTDDGWLRTGDIGFLADGELYIAGRKKNMIVHAGRNFYAHDVETIAGDVAGVYQRHVVAVTDVERERLILVAESDGADPEDLSTALRTAIQEELGLAGVEIHVTARNQLPRTTSGKWRHAEIRQRLTEKGFE